MCGVAAIVATTESVEPYFPANLTSLMLFTLQHRGQEAAGMTASHNSVLTTYKDNGLVRDIFTRQVVESLPGNMVIGHTRYGTAGGPEKENAHPHHPSGNRYEIALAHNGNLLNTDTLRQEAVSLGAQLLSKGDSEVIAELIARSTASSLEQAIHEVCMRLVGAYSMVIVSPEGVYAVRDPNGIRPLWLGKMRSEDGDFLMVASETCALRIPGCKVVREVAPGEVLLIRPDGTMRSSMLPTEVVPRFCVFEMIYFSRPDSLLGQYNYSTLRSACGACLAKSCSHLSKPDAVLAIPASGCPGAIGYANALGVPYVEGLVKNHYVGRTFIAPGSKLRAMGVRLKLNPVRDLVYGKALDIGDDSIVRATTLQVATEMLCEAGARSKNPRIFSPPVKHPCFYGIDTSTKEQLAAANMTVEEIRDYIGADSLVYLSMDGMRGVLESHGMNPKSFCMACFDGQYPTAV